MMRIYKDQFPAKTNDMILKKFESATKGPSYNNSKSNEEEFNLP